MPEDSQLVGLFTNLFKDIEQEKFETDNNQSALSINLRFESILGLITPVIIYHIVNGEYRLIMDNTVDDMWTTYYYESNETKFNYNFAKFILKAFAYSLLEDSSHKLMVSNTGRKNTVMSTINKIPLEIHGMALEFSEELWESQNKISRSENATEANIRQFLKSKKIKTIHEEYRDRVGNQFNTYLELLEGINKKNPVYTKSKLKELMLKTNAWKDKKELEQFWSRNPKDIRKSFLEETQLVDMYKRIFAREIKEIERHNKELEIEYQKSLIQK